MADVEEMLGIIQRLDPPGVGARDLRECLLIQLGPGLAIAFIVLFTKAYGRCPSASVNWSEIDPSPGLNNCP